MGDGMISSRFMVYGLSTAIFLFISCDDKSTKPNDLHTTTFPLKVGNRWTYHEMVYTVPYNVSSLADTAEDMIVRRVVGMDTIMNSIITYVLDDTITYANDTTISVWRYWYAVDDSSLREYGVGTNITGDHSWYETFYSTPHILLNFPIEIGNIWNYNSLSWTIEKKVARSENVIGAVRSIKCDVIYTSRYAGQNRQDSLAKEWYCDEGLICSESGPDQQRRYDSNWVFIDTVGIYDHWELTAIDLIH
jgi:hypothetical protein